MYEILKIRLIFLVLNGCKFGEWHFFNNCCKEKLTNKEYSNIKKMSDYKKLLANFGRI